MIFRVFFVVVSAARRPCIPPHTWSRASGETCTHLSIEIIVRIYIIYIYFFLKWSSVFKPLDKTFKKSFLLSITFTPSDFYGSYMLKQSVFLRRHTPYGNQTDYRIFELNKRLQNWTEDCDNLWWDAFTTEFFEDDAMLTITFCLEDGPKRYISKPMLLDPRGR
uniref:Uncharacterized protein n=1 Tax=Cyprinus carpio TaxID=7962 RepID=A0A8C1LQ64_CYPCA